MKRAILLTLAALAITSYALLSCHHAPQSPEEKIAQQLLAQIDSLSAIIEAQFLPAIGSRQPDESTLQHLFLQTRLAYKKIQWATEYFSASTTRIVNGPPIPEVELSGQIRPPGGLQVIEAWLYPHYNPAKRQALAAQLRQMIVACTEYRAFYTNIPLLNWQIWNAARAEVFRILTLGISGFDAPLSENSILEAAQSLRGLQSILSAYPVNINVLFSGAASYLEANPDFNHFDRAVFITRFGNPLCIGLARTQMSQHFHPIHYRRLLREDAETLFDSAAFDAAAYSADSNADPNLESATGADGSYEQIALGRRLFNDPNLSGPRTRSCATCHQPTKGFTDGLARNVALGAATLGNTASGSAALRAPALVDRHTPSLLLAALQPAEFADLRVNTLEDQIVDVIGNKKEMNGSPLPSQLVRALAAYVRSLSVLNSRFDKYMRGDASALNAQELQGFNLFMGKARCGTCHYMPLFNGALPPLYEKMDPEVIGVPAPIAAKNAAASQTIDTDPGRYGIVPAEPLAHAFKTPTVRNTARTAPYMHNGVFKSLQQVIDFYNAGGGKGKGFNVPNQTLPETPLHLSKSEVAAVVAFIGSLNTANNKQND